MHVYSECLKQRHVKHMVSSNILGRLPEGMGPLVVALFLRSQGLDYGLVGGLAALYGISAALGSPLLGRAVDFFGQARVLVVCMVVSTLGFLSLSTVPREQVLLAALSIVAAGLFTPPLEPCLRSLWPLVLPSERAVKAAYAMDAALQEIVFVSGPLLVVVVANAFGPGGALVVTGAVVLVGTSSFVSAPPVQWWRAEPRDSDWAGPLRSPVLRHILFGFLFAGATIGLLNISVVAYSEVQRWGALSGLILAVNATGALIGGFVYGSRTWPGGAPAHLRWMMFGLAVGYIPFAFTPPPYLALPLAIVSGFSLAPALASAFMVIGDNAPRGTSTEAFAWLITIFMAGNALGSTAAGILLQHFGLGASFTAPTISAGIGLLVVSTSSLEATAGGKPNEAPR